MGEMEKRGKKGKRGWKREEKNKSIEKKREYILILFCFLV